MGVRTLIGTADGHRSAAAMYDSASGWMVGPIFEAEDAEDQIDALLEWFRSGKWSSVAEAVLGADWHMKHHISRAVDLNDPRMWSDVALEKLITYWRARYIGEDGWLLDAKECACGHRHDRDEDGADVGCARCVCGKWTPGNVAAEELAADDPEAVLE